MFISRKNQIFFAGFLAFIYPIALNIAPTAAQVIQARQWALTKQADETIEKYRKENNIPGISVAICKNGNFLYAKGFGWSNVEKKIKASQNTHYR